MKHKVYKKIWGEGHGDTLVYKSEKNYVTVIKDLEEIPYFDAGDKVFYSKEDLKPLSKKEYVIFKLKGYLDGF